MWRSAARGSPAAPWARFPEVLSTCVAHFFRAYSHMLISEFVVEWFRPSAHAGGMEATRSTLELRRPSRATRVTCEAQICRATTSSYVKLLYN